jgi:hypothetical protein
VFGEPVTGFHLENGRASYGIGLQFFFLGYPLHFDWSKLTDLKVSSPNTRFDFWIGFRFLAEAGGRSTRRNAPPTTGLTIPVSVSVPVRLADPG